MTDRSIDINSVLGNFSPFPEQKEFLLPNGVRPSEIKGVWEYNKNEIIQYIPNPNYGGN